MAEKKIEEKGGGSWVVEVKLTRDEFREYWETAKEMEARKVEIKGFRKGQAPMEMAEPYLDKDKIFSEATERAVKATLKEAVEEKEWILVAPPQITIKEEKEGLRYEATVTPFPEVKLGDYRVAAGRANQELKEKLNMVEVTEEEVKKAVEWLRASREKKEGEGTPADVQKTLDFGEAKEVRQLTDEEAATFGNFKSAEELKKSIQEGLMAEKKVREADKNRAKILEEAIKEARLIVPAAMTERAAENMKEELKQSLSGGSITFDEYVKKHYASEEKLNEALRQRAEKEIKAHLVLDAIAKKQNMMPTQEETQEEMNHHLAAVPENRKKEVNLQQLYDFSYGKVKNEKVFKWLEKI